MAVDKLLDKLLTPPEVAEQFRVTVGYLATRRFEGEGPPYVKVGAAVRYRASDVADWLAANTYNSTPKGAT